ncbi:DUF4351 domain-containing protein [Clostridium tyrobutyricum]|uniref:DUF4351 domain-containing protein n=1 Tax=Clostridium tyrobutyricum TaxID=1519 RepID=UPI00068B300A|nr:DUF4351 domain-containing protein [Clostridium tyrobutyricum]
MVLLNSNELFGENVIDFRYILFDVYRYDENNLEKMANMVSTVFLLDKEISREDLMKRLRLTAYVLKKITPEQFDILKMWLKGIMKPRLDTESRTKVEEILEKSSQGEVDIMVSNLGKSIDNIIREGRKEGIKAGRKEGKSELIIKILAKKFIKLPDSYVDRITDLSDDTLDKIAVGILDMEKVEELERYFKD